MSADREAFHLELERVRLRAMLAVARTSDAVRAGAQTVDRIEGAEPVPLPAPPGATIPPWSHRA